MIQLRACFSNACSTRCWRSIQHSLQHWAKHHPFPNLGTGASNDASCVSWDAVLRIRFRQKECRSKLWKATSDGIAGIGTSHNSRWEINIAKNSSFLFSVLLLLLLLFFFCCCWMLVVQYHWLRHSVDGSLAPFWQLWSLSFGRRTCGYLQPSVARPGGGMKFMRKPNVFGKRLNMFHVSSTQCRTCTMPMLHSWAFRDNFNLITIYAIVVVSSCIPIDLASISGGILLRNQGIPLSKWTSKTHQKERTTRESQHLWSIPPGNTGFDDLVLCRSVVSATRWASEGEQCQGSGAALSTAPLKPRYPMIEILVWWWWGRFFYLKWKIHENSRGYRIYRVTWRCLIRVFQVNPISPHGGNHAWEAHGGEVGLLDVYGLRREHLVELASGMSWPTHCTEISLMLWKIMDAVTSECSFTTYPLLKVGISWQTKSAHMISVCIYIYILYLEPKWGPFVLIGVWALFWGVGSLQK